MSEAPLARALRWLHRAEDLLLALALAALLLLALSQIVLRSLFDTGLPWGETVSRAGVLWLAMLGALGAARQQRHISIDALPRVVPEALRWPLHGLGQLGAAAICVWAAWMGFGLVLEERAFPLPFVPGVPSWVPMLVLPAGFGLLALRFTIAAFAPRPPPDLPR
ncbi:TRAP transporter small permease [Silanimonas sp.]|uniref:TRAP transporter small permease n=1 Tax=Silanimonas sp. TaxID=1929290 RepID=UPI001BC456A6|nr:TRAP transporter small permease [Silanimonas sp.]MBS3896119.1 TRAP transporter small permease [Silanimonas sp.]MBS3923831.1 TRAP transporter small permease [Xanthomonadaceae bacterium]